MGLDRAVHAVDKGLQIAQLVVWLIDQKYRKWTFCFQASAIATLGLARLGDAGTSLQFGSNLDSHWLGQMTTVGWVSRQLPQLCSP